MPIDRFSLLSPLHRSTLSAVAALMFYGAWAFGVNFMHGSAAALKAACVQGTYSMMLTAVMVLLIESLYRLMSRISKIEDLVKWCTIIVSCAIVFSTSWWVNAMAGTPEIFNTVILGYIIGAVYTIAYVYGISRNSDSNAGHA